MMRKKILNILKYICLGCLTLSFFPLVVYADVITTTYIEAQPTYFFDNWSTKNAYGYYYYRVFKKGVTRTFIGHKGSSYVLWTVNDTTGVDYAEYSTQTLGDHPVNGSSYNSSMTNYVTVDNHQYSYLKSGSYSAITNPGGWSLNPDFPIVEMNSLTSAQEAVYYTFGDGAGEPLPDPTNWGLVRDPEYSTRIAGNGYAAKRNIDYLSWNNEVDSNGNDISECTINIKAVLGSWSGTTQEDLLNKTYNDFNIGNYTAVDLGSVPASSGMFSVSWQRIIDEAGWNFDSIYSHLENNLFLKQGWYYQLQLVDPDGGEHQWQTLYTPLSSSAAASETVINHNSFDTSIYQVYQDLATINNNTSITINIQDTDYTVTNPDDGDEPSGGVDLWDILKQMLNGIFQIVKNIAALPGKFLEMIQQLITPPQQISEEINTNFNNNMQDLNESQPGLMESMNAVEDIQDTLNQSVNSFNGVPECIFTWDAVTMDLSAFNAGTVTFIAAGSFDFAASFMQMINGFGMSYSEYQFYVSAIIYAWILVFIYRHVYDFLAGTKEN